MRAHLLVTWQTLTCLAALASLGGCMPDVCAPYPGRSCLALTIKSGDGKLSSDQMGLRSVELGIDDATPFPAAETPFSLPVVLALVPAPDFEGEFGIEVTGRLSGVDIAMGAVWDTLTPGAHRSLEVVLQRLGEGEPPDGSASDGASDLGVPKEDLAKPGDLGMIPADLGPPCDGPCPAVLMAQQLDYPFDVAIDGTRIYFTEWGPASNGLEGMVSSVSKSTPCASVDLGCIDRLATNRFRVDSLVVGPSDLCWTEYYENDRDVICRNHNNGFTRKVAQNQQYAAELFLESDRLLWILRAVNGWLVEQGITAIVTDPVIPRSVSRPTPNAVGADSTWLYWSEDGPPDAGGAIWSAARDGQGPKELATGQGAPRSVRGFGGYVYWVNFQDGLVRRARLDGSTPAETIASGQSRPIALAVDASGVYWLNLGNDSLGADGRLMRANHDGSSAYPLIDPVYNSVEVLVDATHVFVLALGPTYGSGHILRVQKP